MVNGVKTQAYALMISFTVLLSACEAATPTATSVPHATTATRLPAPTATQQEADEELIVGFAHFQAGGSWNEIRTDSIQAIANQPGVRLRYSDGQDMQENQIKALRAFIADEVDVIGITPMVELGWEDVFQEAKDAGIPIIVVDRSIRVSDDLYTTHLGYDFVEQGRRAGRAMAELMDGTGNIVELAGTEGSQPAAEHGQGFREILREYPEMNIIASETAWFTRAQGKEAMVSLLEEYGDEIDALYTHSDDMAMGAIQAIEQYGLLPGVDIKIVSIDGIPEALEAMMAGKLNAIVDCNPLVGPQFYELALKVADGEAVPKFVPVEEGIFYPEDAEELLPTRLH
jgi:ABC-type sugar transport system substrate-binding protein